MYQELNLNEYLMTTFDRFYSDHQLFNLFDLRNFHTKMRFVTNALNGSLMYQHILNQSIFFFIAIIIKQYFQWGKKNNWILTICSSMKKKITCLEYLWWVIDLRRLKQKSIILKITCNLSFDDIFFFVVVLLL